PGCWRQSVATAEASRDGWWRSGGRAHADADGFFYFDGWLTDSLRHRGENIRAWELEQAIDGAPGVVCSAAVAVRDELGGEDEIKVFLVLGDPATWDAAAFFDWCERELPRFAVP